MKKKQTDGDPKRPASDRQSSAQGLSVSELNRRIIEAVPCGLVVVSPEGAVLQANEVAQSILGLSFDEITKRYVADFEPETVREDGTPCPVEDYPVSKCLATGQPQPATTIGVRRPDGSLSWAIFTAIPMFDSESRQLSGAVVTFVDISDRKEAEAHLQESEALFHSLFDQVPIGLGLAAPDGRLMAFNDAMLKPGGWSREDIHQIGNVALLYYDPEERRQALAKAQELGYLDQFPARFKRKDGSYYHTLLSLRPIMIKGQRCWQAMVEDVSERRAAEEALRLSEQRFRSLFENVPIGIYRTTPDGRILNANPALVRMLGYDSFEELATRNLELEGFGPGYSRSDFQTAIQRQDEIRAVEAVWTKRDGSLVLVRENARAVRDQRGTILHYEGTVEDITGQRMAEEALRASEQRYRELVENASEVIYTHGLDGQLTSINRAGERITGYSRDEILRLNILDLVAPSSRELALRLMKRQTSTATAANELTFVTRDGREVSMEISLRFLYEEQRAPTVLGIARDVTQRRQFEAQLQQAQKMEAMGKLAGGIAHDFNNLLTGILGYSEMALAELPTEHAVRRDLEEIRKIIGYASALTRQLLTFGRRQIATLESLNLTEFIVNMKDLLRRLIGEHIELRFETDLDLASVKADPGMIEQVVLNLALNARDAMPRGGRLLFETANVELDDGYAQGNRWPVRPGSYVMLAVTDTGIGMDAATQSRIFEPFFTTKDPGKGTGLGLSMVYGIVKQCGGYIWVYSQVGLGTTFKIYLPQTAQRVGSKASSDFPAEHLHGSETILLVEDDVQVRKVSKGILEMNGYGVLEASDGEEAWALSNQHTGRIDLLVTDMIMPKLGGLELAERATASRPEMKVLYISGYARSNLFYHQGFQEDAFLQKPFSLRALIGKVREVLDSKS
ncbi:MAG: PAS domain S-box protein [Acidobacteriota bacterium]